MIRSIPSILILFFIGSSLCAQQKFKELPAISKHQSKFIPPLDETKAHIFPESELQLNIDYTPINKLTLNKNLLEISSIDKAGNPNFIKGSLHNAKNYKSAKAQLSPYLEAARPLMGIKNQIISFAISKEWTDDLATDHFKLRQYYNNIPIYGAEIILHGDQTGTIQELNGNYYNSDQINLSFTSKTITEETAKQAVKTKLSNYREHLNDYQIPLQMDFEQWKSELVIYPFENQFYLAWHIEVHPNLGAHETYIIDATTNEIIENYSNVCNFYGHKHDTHSVGGPESSTAEDLLGTEQRINTYFHNDRYYLIDASRSMFNAQNSRFPNSPDGVIITLDGIGNSPMNDDFDFTHVTSSNNRWNQAEAVSAQANAQRSYEYFKQVHGRESINGEGGNIYSFVNIKDEEGGELDNAFWSGKAIFYGNGNVQFSPLGAALDVAGHEMTHGVVQHSVGFNRMGESGALNESFADIFGTMIERINWSIGETIVLPGVFPGQALRNMADPHNGAQRGDFNNGWQPKHYDELYTGEEDRGGVHFNSGIINHAYYLFATEVGIDRAEQVFYRALTTYLTKSAQFVDLRLAVEKSAGDLYNSTVMRAASTAFDAVGVLSTEVQDYQQDVEENTGQDLILYSIDDKSQLVLANGDFEVLADPLSSTGIISRPSVTDAGDEIVFVGKDKKMHIISIDWEASTFSENVLQDSPNWRNAVISKNGRWVAALQQRDEDDDNQIIVYDRQNGDNKIFNLSNPSFTEGISTGDVLFADAMEFDFTNHTIIYDAFNRISSSDAGEVEYWDIGFLNFWDKDRASWAEGNIEKLFSTLPEGISIGNPTFSKNSPYIIAFDFINENDESNDWIIAGANIETNEVKTIKTSDNIGFPSFSKDDRIVIHNGSTSATQNHLQTTPLRTNKIEGSASQTTTAIRNAEWGVWFSNGNRDFTSSVFETDIVVNEMQVFPNPTDNELIVQLDKKHGRIIRLDIFDNLGKKVISNNYESQKFISEVNITVSNLDTGIYQVVCTTEEKVFAAPFIKH